MLVPIQKTRKQTTKTNPDSRENQTQPRGMKALLPTHPGIRTEERVAGTDDLKMGKSKGCRGKVFERSGLTKGALLVIASAESF